MAIDLFSMKWIVAFGESNIKHPHYVQYEVSWAALKTNYAQRHIIWLCWVRGAAELAIITSNIYHG